ncbi:MAG: hypothetical protein AAF468_11110 [Pseudomonadota bacterium]
MRAALKTIDDHGATSSVTVYATEKFLNPLMMFPGVARLFDSTSTQSSSRSSTNNTPSGSNNGSVFKCFTIAANFRFWSGDLCLILARMS